MAADRKFLNFPVNAGARVPGRLFRLLSASNGMPNTRYLTQFDNLFNTDRDDLTYAVKGSSLRSQTEEVLVKICISQIVAFTYNLVERPKMIERKHFSFVFDHHPSGFYFEKVNQK